MNFFLVGQQNVGKSSIYNILTNKNINIIHPSEGTTRDWHSSKIYKNGTPFSKKDAPFSKQVTNRVAMARHGPILAQNEPNSIQKHFITNFEAPRRTCLLTK